MTGEEHREHWPMTNNNPDSLLTDPFVYPRFFRLGQPHHPLENALISAMNMLTEKRHALPRMNAWTEEDQPPHGCFAYCHRHYNVSARGHN